MRFLVESIRLVCLWARTITLSFIWGLIYIYEIISRIFYMILIFLQAPWYYLIWNLLRALINLATLILRSLLCIVFSFVLILRERSDVGPMLLANDLSSYILIHIISRLIYITDTSIYFKCYKCFVQMYTTRMYCYCMLV